ncbi:MAG: desulfoferrodoxin family protein [Cellulosilyticaceae bacterium]
MCNNQKFFVCKRCGNFVGTLKYTGAKLTCCGEHMTEVVANTQEAATEKHIPVVSVVGNVVEVVVGSVAHPMTEAHHIAWVYIQTKEGAQRKCLPVDGEPKASFALSDGDELVAAYAYCNLHGLWKVEV